MKVMSMHSILSNMFWVGSQFLKNVVSCQEDFLRGKFAQCLDEQPQFAIEDRYPEVPDFVASDEDDVHPASESDAGFAASDASDGVFSASDAEDAALKGPGRRYAKRRTGQLTFLGKTVCLRACARLVGVGESSLQRVRRGEEVFNQKARQKAPVHPTFGFAIRGDSAEKLLHLILVCEPSCEVARYCPILLAGLPIGG